MFFSCDHIITVINLNLKIMWYNRVVTDSNMNILFKERIFIENGAGGAGSYGMDILGNWVEEWWECN
jgi:hypothetical protein